MNNALVVGGNSGIGLSIVTKLLSLGYRKIYVVGKDNIDFDAVDEETRQRLEKHVIFKKTNLIAFDDSVFDDIHDINTLIITAGFGRVALFQDLKEHEIINLIRVNFESCVRVLNKYYSKINSNDDFYTAVMVSISGRIVSPFFSVYGACKAGLRYFIENLNCELRCSQKRNRILEVSPGSLKGTSFNGDKTNLADISSVANKVIENMFCRNEVYIPDFDSIFSDVIKRYENNPHRFGTESFQYKLNSGRLSKKPQITIGYLSGTFDLFHIGHLNLLKRAKEQCDFLIVSVHNNGAWKGKETFIPYEERRAIVESIKYVDQVVEDYDEDSDAWEIYHYDKLFVGSDYKGTDRFNRYEDLLKGKAEIIYFPYTKGTSSTQLREALKKG